MIASFIILRYGVSGNVALSHKLQVRMIGNGLSQLRISSEAERMYGRMGQTLPNEESAF